MTGHGTQEPQAGAPPIWTRPAPGTRRPRFTRAQLAATALRIADTEGLDAVSMRRIATELGAGTMTLYHYVRTKQDLIGLMEDAIMAELLVDSAAVAAGWRPALTAIARQSRAAFLRHPWAITGMRGTGTGPHALRHFEQSLAAVADTGLDAATRLDLIALLDSYVAGFVLKNDAEPDLASVPPDAAVAIEEYLDGQLATGDHPHTAALLGDHGRLAALAGLAGALPADERFERGLRRLLDGIAPEVAQAARRRRDGSPG